MKVLILLILSSVNSFAAQCICQYPGVDSSYGKGYKKEILAYKAGCSFWLGKAKNCRSKKIVNINWPLKQLIKPSSKIVKLGFVGHWSGSIESVHFLEEIIRPIVETRNVSFEIDNTACKPMVDSKLVQNSIKNYSYSSNYITFKGAQTDSIGMWDKLTRVLKKADLMAYADSKAELRYPRCQSVVNRICMKKIVEDQSGFCEDGDALRQLSCQRSKVFKSVKVWKYIK